MATATKKMKDRLAKLPEKNIYTPDEALIALKTVCTEVPRKFDETVEAYFRLGVDAKKAEQQVRGTLVLPNGTGKTPRIIVFAQGDKMGEADKAGADAVGGVILVTTKKSGAPRLGLSIENSSYPTAVAANGAASCFDGQSFGIDAGTRLGLADVAVAGQAERASNDYPYGKSGSPDIRTNAGFWNGSGNISVGAPLAVGRARFPPKPSRSHTTTIGSRCSRPPTGAPVAPAWSRAAF